MQKLIKKISVEEFEQIPEHRKRVFEVSYKTNGDVIRYFKLFQHKRNVRSYLENPLYIDVKLRLLEVVNDEEQVQ